MIGAFVAESGGLASRLVSLSGVAVMIFLAWSISTNRRAIRWRPVLWGIALQLVFGLIVLSPALSGLFFDVVDQGVRRLLSFSEAGADFVFQSVEPHQVMDGGGTAQFVVGRISPPMKTFAFWILPTIVFFSSLMAILYHLGIMQRVVWAIAWVMQRTMGTSRGREPLGSGQHLRRSDRGPPGHPHPTSARMTRSGAAMR